MMYKDMQEILAAVAAGQLTPDQAEVLIEALEQTETSEPESEWTVVDDIPNPQQENAGATQEKRIEQQAECVARMAMNMTENILRSVEKTMANVNRSFEEK